mmetsp:Transcript_25093/g.66713  ORF Transcript_25093/g.66713 Transcript_25093/m.66713 type:complete len:226 (-) Transcript_25093:93-770(-)
MATSVKRMTEEMCPSSGRHRATVPSSRTDDSLASIALATIRRRRSRRRPLSSCLAVVPLTAPPSSHGMCGSDDAADGRPSALVGDSGSSSMSSYMRGLRVRRGAGVGTSGSLLIFAGSMASILAIDFLIASVSAVARRSRCLFLQASSSRKLDSMKLSRSSFLIFGDFLLNIVIDSSSLLSSPPSLLWLISDSGTLKPPSSTASPLRRAALDFVFSRGKRFGTEQ